MFAWISVNVNGAKLRYSMHKSAVSALTASHRPVETVRHARTYVAPSLVVSYRRYDSSSVRRRT